MNQNVKMECISEECNNVRSTALSLWRGVPAPSLHPTDRKCYAISQTNGTKTHLGAGDVNSYESWAKKASPSSEIWYIKCLCGFFLNGLPSQTCAQHVIKHLQWMYSKPPGCLLQPILTNLSHSLRVLSPPFPFMCITAPASRGWRDPGRCTGCWWLLWQWYSQMDAKPCAGFSWWSPSCQHPHLHGDACHRCTPSGSAVRPGACYFLAKPPALRLDPSPCQTSWRSCCRRRSWWHWWQTERMWCL